MLKIKNFLKENGSMILSFLIAILVVSGCSKLMYERRETIKKQNFESLYYNLNCKIVSIQGPTPWSSGKFNGITKMWLLQSLNDTTKYCEYIPYSDSLFYNKKLYDTVHFDYIRKDRFFIINR